MQKRQGVRGPNAMQIGVCFSRPRSAWRAAGARDARKTDEGQRELPLICWPCVPSREWGAQPRAACAGMEAWKCGGAGEGAHAPEIPSRHLSKKDGFDGCGSAGAVANGRLPARPGHREGRFSRIETETTFIETKKELNFVAKFNFRNFYEKRPSMWRPKPPDLLTYLI